MPAAVPALGCGLLRAGQAVLPLTDYPGPNSYGTRTPVGSHSVALLASVIDTCRLRCASATDFLARAIHAARLGLPAPALAPIPANLANPNTDLVGV